MKKILVLTSEYLNKPAANGICADHLVNALRREGHEVKVVCYGKPEEQTKEIKTVSPPKRPCPKGLVLRYAYRAWEMLHTVFRPMVRKGLAREYEKKALEFCAQERFDVLLGVYFPLESLTALAAVKKKFPKSRLVVYELDSVGDGIGDGEGFYKKRMVAAYNRYLQKVYQRADGIFVMRSHEDYWKKTFGKNHGEKLFLADIPVLVEKKLPDLEKKADAPVSFLYGGLIEREYRSPEHLLALFSAFAKKKNATLDFFSKGDCEEELAAAAKKNPAVRQNGYVAPAVLEEAMAKADVLVSIGNRVSRSVPSKVIGYLAYGKPVVHISLQKEDVCAYYLENYPLGLLLNEWDGVEENEKKLYDFVEAVRGRTADFADVEKALFMNTPRYSAEIIAKGKGETNEQ